MIGRRLLGAVPSLVGVVVVTFILTRALPGDPAAFFAGPAATAEAVEEIRARLGLDRGLLTQFLVYLGDLSRGDFGVSLTTGQPVLRDLLSRLPASLELTLCGLFMAMSTALPLGIYAATHPNAWIDHASRLVTTAGVSLPTFFTGLSLVYVFYYLLGWAPAPLGRLDVFATPPTAVTGFYILDSALMGDLELVWACLQQLILPALTLGVFALRNALLPVVTTLGMVFSFMLGANVLVEKVFAWPGIGSYALEALIASDYAPVQAFVLTMGLLYVGLNLLIDMLYGCIDPRVRIES
jgi:peptide/nickel transport system permease protein